MLPPDLDIFPLDMADISYISLSSILVARHESRHPPDPAPEPAARAVPEGTIEPFNPTFIDSVRITSDFIHGSSIGDMWTKLPPISGSASSNSSSMKRRLALMMKFWLLMSLSWLTFYVQSESIQFYSLNFDAKDRVLQWHLHEVGDLSDNWRSPVLKTRSKCNIDVQIGTEERFHTRRIVPLRSQNLYATLIEIKDPSKPEIVSLRQKIMIFKSNCEVVRWVQIEPSALGHQHIITFAADESSGRLAGLAVDSVSAGPPWSVFKWSLDLSDSKSKISVASIEATSSDERDMEMLLLDGEFRAPVSSIFRDNSLITVFVNKKAYHQISRAQFAEKPSSSVPLIRSLRRDHFIGQEPRLPSLPHTFTSTSTQDILLYPHAAYAVGDAQTDFEQNVVKAHLIAKCPKMPKIGGELIDYVGDHARVLVEARTSSGQFRLYGVTLVQLRLKSDSSRYVSYMNIMSFNGQGSPARMCRTFTVQNWAKERGLWSFAPVLRSQ